MSSGKQYDNNMRGVLFLSTRERVSEKQPTYYGTIEIDNVQFRLSGWARESDSGTMYIQIKAQTEAEYTAAMSNAPKPQGDPRPSGKMQERAAEQRQQSIADMDDDIPF